MSIDLSVTNKPAVQKKAEEEPDNREQIRDFVQRLPLRRRNVPVRSTPRFRERCAPS